LNAWWYRLVSQTLISKVVQEYRVSMEYVQWLIATQTLNICILSFLYC
jgi:hypothetical protein